MFTFHLPASLHFPRRKTVKAVLAVLAAGIVAFLLLRPGSAYAAPACTLPPRLHQGDAVTVLDSRPNALRQGAGLGYAKMNVSLERGVVWYVMGGPVCADGMNWYYVGADDVAGWTSEGTPSEGYYLGKTTARPQEGGSAAGACRSRQLALFDEVTVIAGGRQHIRSLPRRNAPHTDWFKPGQILTLSKGPRCADGWVWWQVANAMGRPLGWTAEGDGRTVWLGRSSAATGASSGGSAQPLFTGEYQATTPGDYRVTVSPDRQAATVVFSGLEAATPIWGLPAGAQLHLSLPTAAVNGSAVVKAEFALKLFCEKGGQASLTGTLNGKAINVACPDSRRTPTDRSGPLTFSAPLRPGTPVTVDVTLKAWSQTPAGNADLGVDLIDLSLAPR